MKANDKTIMIPPPRQEITFSAGGETSKFQVLVDVGELATQLVKTFPVLASYLKIEAIITVAYPASLGLRGIATLVDTKLHPPNFNGALSLAHQLSWPVILAAQPLAGADLLLHYVQQGHPLPKEILWAAGGYYFPQSLEEFLIRKLAAGGCRLTCLFAYGAAEVGHTRFAALDRFSDRSPRYRKLSDCFSARIDPRNEHLLLATPDQTIDTKDLAQQVDGFWRITSSQHRLSTPVRDELESWTDAQWERRTGYLVWDSDRRALQLRSWRSKPISKYELAFHDFWGQFDGGMTYKPRWGG